MVSATARPAPDKPSDRDYQATVDLPSESDWLQPLTPWEYGEAKELVESEVDSVVPAGPYWVEMAEGGDLRVCSLLDSDLDRPAAEVFATWRVAALLKAITREIELVALLRMSPDELESAIAAASDTDGAA